VAVGLATASDTLGSQSFGGKNKFLVGLTLQRGLSLALLRARLNERAGLMIVGLAMFPSIALWLNGGLLSIIT
jgi:hypothetical protein